MSDRTEIENLRRQLALLEHKSTRSGWLFRQLWKKIKYFPRDLSRRLRRSAAKRRARRDGVVARDVALTTQLGLNEENGKLKFVHATPTSRKLIAKLEQTDPAGLELIDQAKSFLKSPEFDDLLTKAIALEPNIKREAKYTVGLMAPLNDVDYEHFCEGRDRIPDGPFDSLIMVPFGKMGGADFVAGVLSRALTETGRVLILRTDHSDWVRPDWYDDDAVSVDISDMLDRVANRSRALYTLVQHIDPQRIFNVNSRRCFDMYEYFGERLTGQYDLYSYYFCADRDADGAEVGYPVMYIASQLPHLTAAIVDSASLVKTLTERYGLPPELAAKLKTVYTPAMLPPDPAPVVTAQLASRGQRDRPRLLWAGRLDRQKRFDLVIRIAAALPEIDFLAWGKAVLDAPPNLSRMPPNLTLNDPFTGYDELPFAESDGWLYTSEWDGVPTILIECGAMGVPIVASAVGGVPELIDETTGWPVHDTGSVDAYVSAIRQMLSDDEDRERRALALRRRVLDRHEMSHYKQMLGIAGAA